MYIERKRQTETETDWQTEGGGSNNSLETESMVLGDSLV